MPTAWQETIDRSIVPWEAVGISMISHVTLFQPMTDSESLRRYNKYTYICIKSFLIHTFGAHTDTNRTVNAEGTNHSHRKYSRSCTE